MEVAATGPARPAQQKAKAKGVQPWKLENPQARHGGAGSRAALAT